MATLVKRAGSQLISGKPCYSFSMITDEQIRNIATRARKFAYSKGGKLGNQIDPDDFSQFCVHYYLEKGSVPPRISMIRRFADFMRERFGYRTDTDSQIAKRSINQSAKQLKVTSDKGVGAKKMIDRALLKSLNTYFLTLDKYQRVIYVLYHSYEISLQEIADMRGVDESRISQELTEIQGVIDRNIRREGRLRKKPSLTLS